MCGPAAASALVDGRLLGHFRRRVRDSRDLDRACLQHGLHPMAADPAYARETQARAGVEGCRPRRVTCSSGHQAVTSALRNPSGLSRVASSASPRPVEGKAMRVERLGSRRPDSDGGYRLADAAQVNLAGRAHAR